MVLFPFLRDSLSASPDSDTVILDVKKTQIQEQLKRIRSPDFTEADNSKFESEERDDITINEQLMEVECDMNENVENLLEESEHHQEVNNANPDADTEDDVSENVTIITPEVFPHGQRENLGEEEAESVKNEPVSEEETIDNNQESEDSKKPADDNIDSLLADSEEENKEPLKTSEQNQDFYVCPYPKGICSKKWKKYKGNNTIQIKSSMKNHILKAHFENEFTLLLNASFTREGKCIQCKNRYMFFPQKTTV